MVFNFQIGGQSPLGEILFLAANVKVERTDFGWKQRDSAEKSAVILRGIAISHGNKYEVVFFNLQAPARICPFFA
jgi:hypothetical protein